jgi:hypothetical protein
MHPLSLSLKLVTPPELVGVVCANCRMKHRLTLRRVAAPELEKPDLENDEMVFLQTCSQSHPEDVRISLVDVVKDLVEFRCRPCRRIYHLEVGIFETKQAG